MAMMVALPLLMMLLSLMLLVLLLLLLVHTIRLPGIVGGVNVVLVS